MLLVVLSVFGARPRCLRFIEAAKAPSVSWSALLRTSGGVETTARRAGIVAISVSYANGGRLHRLIEGPWASPEG